MTDETPPPRPPKPALQPAQEATPPSLPPKTKEYNPFGEPQPQEQNNPKATKSNLLEKVTPPHVNRGSKSQEVISAALAGTSTKMHAVEPEPIYETPSQQKTTESLYEVPEDIQKADKQVGVSTPESIYDTLPAVEPKQTDRNPGPQTPQPELYSVPNKPKPPEVNRDNKPIPPVDRTMKPNRLVETLTQNNHTATLRSQHNTNPQPTPGQQNTSTQTRGQ